MSAPAVLLHQFITHQNAQFDRRLGIETCVAETSALELLTTYLIDQIAHVLLTQEALHLL